MNQQNVTIQGRQFVIPAPYAEGHSLDAAEAAAINQLYAENVRNNFASRIKKAEDDKTTPPGQTELDGYCAEYKFGFRQPGAPKLDPVESEARKLARVAVLESLKKKGTKAKDLAEGQLDELVKGAVAKYPVFREKAKAIVETRASALDGMAL